MKKFLISIFLVAASMFYMPSMQANVISEKAEHVNTHHKLKNILLVVAMDKEAAPIIEAFGLKKTSHSFSGLPMKAYSGKFNHLNVFLILNGEDPVYKVQNVGTQPATLSTYLGLKHFHPDLIINIGTAGGIPESRAKIGDVYVSEKIYFYARRVPIPGYKEYGIGAYESAHYESIISHLNMKTGMICSGDSFDENKVDDEMILQFNCSAREMEAAGVAWVSMLAKTPMFAMKGITDIVGSETSHDDFKKHFSEVMNKVVDALKLFLDNLDE